MINTIKQSMKTDESWAPLVLRIAAGIIFFAHGSQKLFGAFGGYGLEGTGQWMASVGLEPGYLMALLAGLAEFLGGIAIFFGLLTRPAALMLSVTMVVAILSVHLGNGLFMANNGYEFGLALLVISLSLVISGGGRWSLDHKLSQGVR
ncbi:DoxD-like family protein [Idiomarina tyrosinivorans]|uniref:DoxD-like family protein n=1 Tax=Idiomarina tyrosinivorans TaxID=1445662 RepID=A0A432ZQ58_9GAMM|nr:DoxX family protein [Idiomarina tyrosinivorans]RUO79981.1 DoxD-like family protein [Idiomarina tyrosinivorans]